MKVKYLMEILDTYAEDDQIFFSKDEECNMVSSWAKMLHFDDDGGSTTVHVLVPDRKHQIKDF